MGPPVETLPSPEDGRSLREVLPSRLDAEDRSLYEQLVEAWTEAGKPEPLSISDRNKLIRYAPEFLVNALPDGLAKTDFQFRFRERWEDPVLGKVSHMFRYGKLRAWGRPRSQMAALERIPDHYWERIDYLDIELSAVRFAVRDIPERLFCDLRVFAIEHAPDTLGLVSKMSLIEAFSRFVVGPHEAGILIDDDNVIGWSRLRIFNPQEFADADRPVWPAAFELWQMNPDWQGRFGVDLDDRGPMHRRIQDRAEILIRWLRRGTLLAWGSPQGEKALRPVPRGCWSSPDLFIDFKHGSIQDQTRSLYERIELRPPADASKSAMERDNIVAVKSEAPRSPSKEQVADVLRNRGGRPPEYPWEKVTQQMVIWADNEKFPGSKGALVRAIQDYVEKIGPRRPGDTTVKDWLNKAMPDVLAHAKTKKQRP